MKNLLNKQSDIYQSSAKIVDGNLILSLPDAINPVVWRMELGSVKSSALEVKPAENETFTLSLKTPKGEVHDIAPFATRDLALQALMRVSAALQGGHGRFTTAPSTTTTQNHSTVANKKQEGSATKWLLTLGGILLVIFLFAYLSTLTPQQAGTRSVSGGSQPSSNTVTGVPQSADEVLRGY